MAFNECVSVSKAVRSARGTAVNLTDRFPVLVSVSGDRLAGGEEQVELSDLKEVNRVMSQ